MGEVGAHAVPSHRRLFNPIRLLPPPTAGNDGWLTRHGLLDLDAIDHLLGGGARVDPILKRRVFSHMECWVRSLGA
jgi:hypothetical protein